MGVLIEKMRAGEPVIGTFVGIGHPAIVEMAGCAGFDFVVIDMEHSCMGLETVENMVRAGAWAGTETVIRVPSVDETLIGRLLDAGVSGIQVPQVTSRAHAEQAVAASKYPPSGSRGYMPVSRASRYFADGNKSDHIAKANKDALVVAQVEGSAGLQAVGDIISTPGLGVVFVGPYDLSVSLGLAGQVTHAEVQSAVDVVIEKAGASGVKVGIFADDPKSARDYIERGVGYVTVGLDVTYLSQAFRRSLCETKRG